MDQLIHTFELQGRKDKADELDDQVMMLMKKRVGAEACRHTENHVLTDR